MTGLVVAALMALVPLWLLAAGPFNDLNPGSPHNDNIIAISDAGITRGCDPGVAYCPNGLVTREEMASFLARTAGLVNNPPVANAKTAQTAQTATNATNAGHATTADTATNATQLGGQPASAYALNSQVATDTYPVYYRLGGSIEAAPGTLATITITNSTQSTQRWEIRGQFSVSIANNDPVRCPCNITATIYGPNNITNIPQATAFYPANPAFHVIPLMVMVYVDPGVNTFRLQVDGNPAGIALRNPILIAEYHPIVRQQP